MVKKGEGKTATPKKEGKKSQSAKFQTVVESAADKFTSARRQTRSQTKTALKKSKVLTRGKEDEISRSKSNLSALVEAQKKKGGKKGKKDEKESSEEEK